jgi:RND superfamily putative drug exporter
MFGIALAAAVALDAFVLRTLLVPALMHMLGGANWWLPKWLDRRLPRISIEPPECGEAHASMPGQRPTEDEALLDVLVKAEAEERKRDVHDLPG